MCVNHRQGDGARQGPATKITGMNRIKPVDLDLTHALDGFRLPAARRETPQELSHLLDGWRPDASIASRSAERLTHRPAQGGPAAAADIEDVKVMGRPEPDAVVDLDGVAAVLNAAVALAQGFDGQAFVESSPMDLLDRQVDAARHPRLLTHWRPEAWIGLRRRLVSTGPVAGTDGQLLEQMSPQWLLAVWAPQRAQPVLLGRWPEQALLADVQAAEAADEMLLASLPKQALLWMGDWEANWVLLAELLLQHDATLQPFQRQTLREFSQAERTVNYLALNEGYLPGTDGRVLRRKT